MIHHYSVIYESGVVGITTAGPGTVAKHGLAYADVKGREAHSRVVAFVRLSPVPATATPKESMT